MIEICLGPFCCCLGIWCVFYLIFKRRRNRFDRLRNIDVLLRENEIVEDNYITQVRISNEMYEVNYDEIKVERIIGESGRDSVVFKAEWKGRDVAFKCFKTRFMNNQEAVDEFQRNLEILPKYSHPCLVNYYGATLKPPRVGLLMEICTNGFIIDYYESVKKESGKNISMEEKIRHCFEIINAMSYLHGHNIILRDLRLERILVSEKGKGKVNFISSIMKIPMHRTTQRIPFNPYLAPEILRGEYSKHAIQRCDVYSFSMIMYCILTERESPSYSSNKEEEGLGLDVRIPEDPNRRPDVNPLNEALEGTNHNWIIDCVNMCWKDNPEERLSFDQLRNVFIEQSEVKLEEMKTEDEELSFEIAEKKFEDAKMEIKDLREKLEKMSQENEDLKKQIAPTEET